MKLKAWLLKNQIHIEIIKTKKSNFENYFLKNEDRKNFGFEFSSC